MGIKQIRQFTPFATAINNDDTLLLQTAAGVTRGVEAQTLKNSVVADVPVEYTGEYIRSNYIKIKSNVDPAINRLTIVMPLRMRVYIGSNPYICTVETEIDITLNANWDTGTAPTAAQRAGNNYYIYACTPSSGNIIQFLLSANSSAPSGRTVDNSRKIGGFHCCAADAGTLYSYNNFLETGTKPYENHIKTASISGHWMTGFLQGDIIPYSIWDLIHRPISAPEGMTFDPCCRKWCDIYLPSVSSNALVSVNGGTIADGGTTPAFHWLKFSQWFSRIGKRLPTQHEFVSMSLGCPQSENIQGDADPGTTGPHTAVSGQRILSNIGCEDMVGVMWQCGEGEMMTDMTVWGNNYDANDANVGGGFCTPTSRQAFGGLYSESTHCGSRGERTYYATAVSGNLSARGVADPL